jgi:hypothetical protein
MSKKDKMDTFDARDIPHEERSQQNPHTHFMFPPTLCIMDTPTVAAHGAGWWWLTLLDDISVQRTTWLLSCALWPRHSSSPMRTATASNCEFPTCYTFTHHVSLPHARHQSWLPMLRMRTTRSTLVPRPAAKDAPAAARVYVFALAHTRTHGVVEGGGRSCQVCTLLQHPPH